MTRPSPEERFWSRVEKTEQCWLWTALTNKYGYGLLSVSNHHVLAHRFAYELLVGPLPRGLVVDHLCRVRNCVNPDHLEPVTDFENKVRGLKSPLKTACPQGHDYTDPNNVRIVGRGRACAECHRIDQRARARAKFWCNDCADEFSLSNRSRHSKAHHADEVTR